MSKIAVVFGLSEQGEYLAKRLIFSFYEHIARQCSHDIHIFPYECNFIISDMKKFSKGMNNQEHKAEGYSFEPFVKQVNWSDLPPKMNVTTVDCSDELFTPFFLPDVAVYHDFATKYSQEFDFVLYCHNDLIFSPTQVTLDDWTSILEWDSEYSFISELRSTANYDISLRFHMCFVFVNVQKFNESSLSFVNDYVLMDGQEFYIYGNGGTGLVASLYKKHPDKPQWRPYILDIHGVYRGREITTEDKWFVHPGEIEWNRSQPLSEGSSVERTKNEYIKAKDYVRLYKQRISD